MSQDIYDRVTKRRISAELAYSRGFPSQRFAISPAAVVFAIADKRKKSGFRVVVLVDKREIANTRRSKKAQQIYPPVPPSVAASLPLAPVRVPKNWQFNLFTLPLSLAVLGKAGTPGRYIGEIQFMKGDTIMHSDAIDLTDNSKYNFEVADWWESHTNDGFLRYNTSSITRPFYRPLIEESDTLRIIFYNTVAPSNITKSFSQQKFKDSMDEHCIFGEIIRYFEKLVDEAQSTKTKQNRASYLRKAKQLLEMYKDGIPEGSLESVAKALDCSIVIEDPMFNTIRCVNPKSKNKKFRYIWSRMDHGEYATISHSDEPEMVTKEEAKDIMEEHFAARKWCRYTNTVSDPELVQTAAKTYRVSSKLGEIMFEFGKTFDWGMRVDAVREPALAKFLKAGAKVMINWKNTNRNPTDEIDMRKAYTQFKTAPCYQGFPAIITNIGMVAPDHDVVAHPGVYEVTILKMPNASGPPDSVRNRSIKLARAFGFNEGQYILTSPWIVMLRSFGVTLKTNGGAWGKRFEFEFSAEMIDSKAYQIWTGCQIHLAEDLKYKMRCDAAYANSIIQESPVGDRMRYCRETQTLLMTQPKEHHWIMPHISAFIIGYTQLHVFREALKYELSEIVGTKLDSILLSCPPRDIGPLFVDIKTEPDWDGEIRMSDFTVPALYTQQSSMVAFAERPFLLGDAFVSGPGGGGKTYKILHSRSLRNPLYTTRAWKLIAEKVHEFGVEDIPLHGTSINQLLGFDYTNKKTQSYKEKWGSPAVIVCDEMSMWSNDEVMKLKEMYPYSQIIMAGDYAHGHYYQSSCFSPDKLYHPETYIMLDADLRSKDAQTKAFKSQIRHIIDSGTMNDLRKFLMDKYPMRSFDSMREEYDLDFILTGTNERVKYFTKELLHETKNHNLVKSHNMGDVIAKKHGDENAHLHGELVAEPIPGRTEPRHAFTVHSFQGITIRGKRCYVDLMALAFMQDVYTAISRIETMDQIHLIY